MRPSMTTACFRSLSKIHQNDSGWEMNYLVGLAHHRRTALVHSMHLHWGVATSPAEVEDLAKQIVLLDLRCLFGLCPGNVHQFQHVDVLNMDSRQI